MFKTIRNLINLINYPSNWKDAVIVSECKVIGALKKAHPNYKKYIATLDGGFIKVCTQLDNDLPPCQFGDKVKVLLWDYPEPIIVWVEATKK